MRREEKSLNNFKFGSFTGRFSSDDSTKDGSERVNHSLPKYSLEFTLNERISTVKMQKAVDVILFRQCSSTLAFYTFRLFMCVSVLTYEK